MDFPELEPYARIVEPPHAYYFKSGWDAWVLDSLRRDFSDVPVSARREYRDGRVVHFAYQPEGAPGRILVRRIGRGSYISPLRDRFLGTGRFLESTNFQEEVRKAGINVPEIVAFRITRSGPFFRFLQLMTEVPDAQNLYRLACNAPMQERRNLIRHFGEALRGMHEAGFYHGDLTLRNVLLSGDNGRSIHFIDLEGGTRESSRSESRDRENIRRLFRFVEKWLVPHGLLSRSDKFRFLTAYAGSPKDAKSLARRIGSIPFGRKFWWKLTGEYGGHGPK